MRIDFTIALAIIALGSSDAGAIATKREHETFTNPILWADLADPDVFRVNDTYYYSASTMHYSPGAPVLKSYDLVNWEIVGHSVPELPGARFTLTGNNSASYIKGVWASSLQYRESNGIFYWYGCIQGEGHTHIYTASQPEGPWTHHPPIPECYYDLGLLIDDDDTMYIAYGAVDIRVAQLTPDGLQEIKTQVVYTEAAARYIEGSRFYKINGNYYIFVVEPASTQHILKSTAGPWGPYEIRNVIDHMSAPVAGAGSPHQGGLVDTPEGDWYYMGFVDVYPGGRIPVLAPIMWDSEGWPHVITDANGGWAVDYPKSVETTRTVDPYSPYVDRFQGPALDNRWEWNHNPNNDAWDLGPDGLTLRTATVCEGLHGASNTLTQRILGPRSQATFHLDISNMTEGDQAGVTVLRGESAYLGVHKRNGTNQLVYVDGIKLDRDQDWLAVSNGYVKAEGPQIQADNVWLRMKADITPSLTGENEGITRYTTFWYSLDGANFTQLGPDFAMINEWYFFMGHRFGVFNWAKVALGGAILVKEFAIDLY